jgi:hypothetical protein
MKMNVLVKSVLAVSVIILCVSCSSKPPEPVQGKKWGVNDSGQWEEQETHETTIILIDDKPKHTLPKDLGKK